MNNSSTSVLLVGRPGVLRNALQSVVDTLELGEPVTADGTRLAFENVRQYHPIVMLVATGLPTREVIDLIHNVKEKEPDTRCMVLTETEPAERLFVAAGADQVLLIDTMHGELPAALINLLEHAPST